MERYASNPERQRNENLLNVVNAGEGKCEAGRRSSIRCLIDSMRNRWTGLDRDVPRLRDTCRLRHNADAGCDAFVSAEKIYARSVCNGGNEAEECERNRTVLRH